MIISNELKRLREEAGLSQRELADRLEIGFSTLRSYEKGDRIPPADVIVRICRFFSVSSDFLLGLSASEDVQPVSVQEDLRADAAAVMKAAAALCEREGSRTFSRSVLPIYRRILQLLGDLTDGTDESYARLIAEFPEYAVSDRPGALPEELRLKVLTQVAESGAVDPELQKLVSAGKAYSDGVKKLAGSAAMEIAALVQTAIATEFSASGSGASFSVRKVSK